MSHWQAALILAASVAACGGASEDGALSETTHSTDGAAQAADATVDATAATIDPSNDAPASEATSSMPSTEDGATAISADAGTDARRATPDAQLSVPDSGVADLTMLRFDSLPINSVRYSVRGYDPRFDLCVEIIWDFSNTGHAMGRHCDDFGPNFPYVFIEKGPCSAGTPVHYGGNAEVLKASGCVEFVSNGGQAPNFVDVLVDVKSDVFTGTIRARN